MNQPHLFRAAIPTTLAELAAQINVAHAAVEAAEADALQKARRAGEMLLAAKSA